MELLLQAKGKEHAEGDARRSHGGCWGQAGVQHGDLSLGDKGVPVGGDWVSKHRARSHDRGPCSDHGGEGHWQRPWGGVCRCAKAVCLACPPPSPTVTAPFPRGRGSDGSHTFTFALRDYLVTTRMRWRKDQEPWFYFLVTAGRLWKIIFLPELATGPTVRTPSSLKCSNSEREMVTVTEGCLFWVGRKTRKGQLLGYSLENVRKARSTGKFIYIFIYTYTNM